MVQRACGAGNCDWHPHRQYLCTDRTVNRWLIPIGAVAVHICIGSVYAWSTLNRPILALFSQSTLVVQSSLHHIFDGPCASLGLSAAFGGPWVERSGPRVAATAAAMFFGSGLIVGGVGLTIDLRFLVFLGMGVIGGTSVAGWATSRR